MKKLFVICMAISSFAFGQDSLKVMYYNLLKYPSQGANRYIYQKKFIHYAQPDVFVVNELESEIGANLILDSALNVNGVSHYQMANFVDGYDTDNCLFYNSNKLGLVSQLQLGTVLRDISVYRMYYKAPNLTAQTDTIYLWFLACHLKAGVSDFQQRNQEAQQAKYYLNDIVNEAENVFIGGDFNFYSGYESGCQTILNTGAIPMIDPANAIGNWSGDWAYANWHTQSTRNSSFGGGVGGGMDDRFDLIFVSEDVMNNQNGVSYIAGTYRPLGQDGNHFNDAINAGSNAAVPDSIADALFNSSDHLPIMMDVVFDETANINASTPDYIQAFYNAQNNCIAFRTSLTNFDLKIYDLTGRIVMQTLVKENCVPVPEGMKGIYVWEVNYKEIKLSEKISIY